MKKILIFALIAFCSLNSFGQVKKNGKKPAKKTTTAQTQKKAETPVSLSSPVSDEEYAVYIAILGDSAKLFVVLDRTAVDDFGSSGKTFFKQTFSELKPETIEDFNSKNKKSSSLERNFPTKNEYFLISDEELKLFFGKTLDWQGFYKKYPNSGGYHTFSRAGFSEDKKQALVYTAHSCGGLCGEGQYYFLKNENGEWKVVKKQMTWIS